jgi:hypothetical protein
LHCLEVLTNIIVKESYFSLFHLTTTRIRRFLLLPPFHVLLQKEKNPYVV